MCVPIDAVYQHYKESIIWTKAGDDVQSTEWSEGNQNILLVSDPSEGKGKKNYSN